METKVAHLDITELKKKYPVALHPLIDNRKELFPLLRPDVTVKIDKADCLKVTYTVTFVPSMLALLAPAPNPNPVPIDVLIYDDLGSATHRHYFAASTGQTINDTVDIPLPSAGFVPPAHWSRKIFVLADPFMRVMERKEGNNLAMIDGKC